MADAPIHVKAALSEDPDLRSVPFLISRLIDQKGGFRNVTEESLEAEIRAGSTGSSPTGDAETSEDEAEEEKSRPEQLREARTKLAELAMEAYNESAHALDMVSLLMSKSQPAHAEPTISPFLKAALPLGCLGVEPVQAAPVADQKAQDDKAVSLGWKLQALNNSADELLRSASRLEEEVRRETEYWEQASSIKDKGWSVCRLPRERHMLGVRYGFLEAAPSFRDKGMAALRSKAGGGLELDLGLSEESTTQRIRARVMQGDRTVAVSPMDNTPPPQDRSMEESILAARNGLFDAELFHEIFKEGRGLMSHGVTCPGGSISLPLEEGKTIRLELVDSGAAESELQFDSTAKRYDKLAQLVVLALRILLCYAHQQRYNRRTAVPRPLTTQKEQEAPTPILQPLLLQLKHTAIIHSCRTFLDDVAAIYAAAGMKLDANCSANAYGIPKLDSVAKTEDVSMVEALVTKLCEPLHAEFYVATLSESTTLVINVHTGAEGTSFVIDTNLSFAEATQERTARTETLWTFDEMVDFLCSHLAVDLLYEAEKSSPRWVNRSLHELRLSTASFRGKHHSMNLKLDRIRLLLKFTVSSDGTSREEQRIWYGDASRNVDKKGFYESLAEFDNTWHPQTRGLNQGSTSFLEK